MGVAEQADARGGARFVDVSDPELYRADAWQVPFRRLRQEEPVHFFETSLHGPYWAITKHADIMEIELNDAVFSSASEWGGIQIQDDGDIARRKNLIRMDRPEHTGHRRTVAPIVAPTNLANMTDLIRQRTEAVLDGLPRGETINWVDHVSIPLTTMMLATLFGFPFDEREKLTYWSDVGICDVNAPDAPVTSEDERRAVLADMAARFRELFDERAARAPSFDLISMLAHSDVTRNMDAETFMGTVMVLIIGGNDTTRNSMTGGVHALHDYPEQDRLLRSDPDLVRNMVSETIRWQTPLQHMRRTAREDIEFRGKTIRKGDKVVMWYISGNFDEEAFEDPDSFNIARPNARRHLSFGAGIHRCVGDRLAELQLRILWEEILKRGLRISVEGPPERIYSANIRAFRSLPVRITV
ncbi:cytochrome P450 [Minwuia sp.]|uniref:cytochrome P450 n=1 Tax=Minwuia sp. TaxID=2493630 RepID=UPI003A8FEF16